MKLIHCPLTTDQIHEIRVDLYRVTEDESLTDTTHQGAIVMINYYGAVLDARMATRNTDRVGAGKTRVGVVVCTCPQPRSSAALHALNCPVWAVHHNL